MGRNKASSQKFRKESKDMVSGRKREVVAAKAVKSTAKPMKLHEVAHLTDKNARTIAKITELLVRLVF